MRRRSAARAPARRCCVAARMTVGGGRRPSRCRLGRLVEVAAARRRSAGRVRRTARPGDCVNRDIGSRWIHRERQAPRRCSSSPSLQRQRSRNDDTHAWHARSSLGTDSGKASIGYRFAMIHTTAQATVLVEPQGSSSRRCDARARETTTRTLGTRVHHPGRTAPTRRRGES